MLSDLNLMLDQVNCSFVSEKVSKIRIVQEKYRQADTFITGGWGSDVNTIGLWKLAKDDLSNDDNDEDYMPNAISKVPVDGDVTGLEFINKDLIVCSTSANNGRINFSHLEAIFFWHIRKMRLDFLTLVFNSQQHNYT